MPRRKTYTITRRIGEPIPRFTHSEWNLLEVAYGTSLSHEARVDLTEALDAWSMLGRPMIEFTYGKEEAQRMARISASADRLLALVRSSSELEDLMIRDAVSETQCDLEKFLAMLGKLAQMKDRADELGEEVCGPEELQIGLIADALRENDCPVHVAKKSGGVSFTPSPFVRLVSCLWELRPEIRVYTPTGDHEANLSQWIAERLRAK